MTSTATSIHVPPPRLATPANATANRLVVAPLIQFASPYLAIQFTENKALLGQIHPDYSLSEEAQILFLRLQDRIAHYILAVDYYGHQSEWARENGLSFPATTIDSTASVSSVLRLDHEITAQCRSSLQMIFPNEIGRNLEKFGSNDRHKAFLKFSSLKDIDSEALRDFKKVGLTFGIETGERWISDFQAGLKKTAEGSVRARGSSMEIDTLDHGISANPISPKADRYDFRFKISLSCFVEYLTAEMFELSGNAARKFYQREIIHGIDMWRAISDDDELMKMTQILAIDWRVIDSESAEAATSVSRVSLGLSQPTSIDDGLLALFESEWKDELTKVQGESSACWFSQPSEVQSVARQFARGELLDSSISLSLRQYHCRPYRYWGHHTNSLFREDWHGPSQLGGYSYVSFLLEDGEGEEWHIMIEYLLKEHDPKNVLTTTRTLGNGRIILLESAWDYGMFSMEPDGFPGNSKITIKVQQTDRWPMKPSNEHQYVPHVAHVPVMSVAANMMQQKIIEDIRQWHRMLLQENMEYCPSHMSAAAKLINFFPSGTQLPIFRTYPITLTLGDGANTKPAEQQLDKEAKEEEKAPSSQAVNRVQFDPLAAIQCIPQQQTGVELHFNRLIPRLLHITDYEKYGPTLYLANQPQKIRHTFTVSLIDESMIAHDLAPLPSVLVSLIADYHTFDLPYLNSEIKAPSPPTAEQREAVRVVFGGSPSTNIGGFGAGATSSAGFGFGSNSGSGFAAPSGFGFGSEGSSGGFGVPPFASSFGFGGAATSVATSSASGSIF